MGEASPFGQQVQRQIDAYLHECLQIDYILQYDQFLEPYLDTYHMALNEVIEPIQELVFLPGKRWRPALTLLHILLPYGENPLECLNEIGHLAAPLVSLVELLHSATLIADDIEDGSKLRRGAPALHLRYGLDRALNACGWACFSSGTMLQPLKKNNYDELVQQLQTLAARLMSQIHLGQALDIRWHRQLDAIPSVEQYFCMINLKTGVLAGFAAEIGTLLAQALSPEYQAANPRALWQRLGGAFQVLDDLLNITVGNPGKLRGDDWLEGKKSLPLCLFVNDALQASQRQERRNFVASLMQRAQNAAELPRVLEEFLECGRQALEDSVIWLERELGICRQLAAKFYAPFSNSPCPAELMALLAELETQTQNCRNFLECHPATKLGEN